MPRPLSVVRRYLRWTQDLCCALEGRSAAAPLRLATHAFTASYTGQDTLGHDRR
jgi:hypothetical protein